MPSAGPHPLPPGRIRARDKAREILAQAPWFLDTETTGLDGEAEVVELAVVDVEGRVVVETLIEPRGTISGGAFAVHGIADEMVRSQPLFEAVWAPLVEERLASRPIVAYNAPFDTRMIRQSLRIAGRPLVGIDNFHCAMALFTDFYGRRTRLELAAAHCGVEPDGRLHRALADADLTRRLVLAIADAADPHYSGE